MDWIIRKKEKCLSRVQNFNPFQTNLTLHYGSAWVDRWSQVLLLGFWHVIHQNCRPIAVVLYLKELLKIVFSIWSKKQLKEIPLRALKGGKMPLNIFLQASKQLFWLKVQCCSATLLQSYSAAVIRCCSIVVVMLRAN